MPSEFFDVLNCQEIKDGYVQRLEQFKVAFFKIAEYLVTKESITFDEVMTLLCKDGIMTELSHSNNDYISALYLILCAVSWQTMLFRPRCIDHTHFDIHDEQGGYRGDAYMCLKLEVASCTRMPLSELLMGFGVLLPSKNLCLSDDDASREAFQRKVEVNAKRFNAHFLTSIAGVRLKWVDTLACHLEYNPATKELFLFRFPSFILSCPSHSSGTGKRTVLQACATTNRFHCQWATESEVGCLLNEILLSYRLLFGQTKKSRALFRSLDPFRNVPRAVADPLLPVLCGKRSCHGLLPLDTTEYYLPRDFPVLRYRLSVLQDHLARATPRKWVQLWHDNRDSAHWLTFWAVIVFGALGTLLALLQVILQAVQVAFR
ncbi:hypothetical protein CNMCM6457_010282 [Aspergillus fumigatiaffinis]|jgi:hypothetical protein|nr:hypothetical protein CNMCM6457_010282 [Aspergillus fumigatiaffinis]